LSVLPGKASHSNMNGVLNIDKPAGMSSHDVVLQVRRMLRERRVGHTGTLDPLATGVLVLCLGKATRIARYLEGGTKEYAAVMKLGIVTDTLDAEGRVLQTRTYAQPDRSRVLEALHRFTGTITQTPPAYSAIKIGGVASYKLARQGKATSLKPRAVAIYDLELCDYQDPFIQIRVRCSKGVYIRTLCADIGEALGAGAHLTNLRRTASGPFRIEHAVTLDQLSAAVEGGDVDDLVIPMDRALKELPFISVNDDDSKRIAHGSRVMGTDGDYWIDRELVRIHDNRGTLLAVGSTRNGELRPVTVFC
jgi:tRNA pseudouridine55 synthase